MPRPEPYQKAWMKLGFGMFIHFGINTYYDKEWSDGTLDPAKFNPTQLDTDQWCRVAKDAGMNYIVLVTKHHDGFCLWPSKLTDYSVKATPFKKDILEKAVNSARKYGLKVGFYYSLWDRHERSHDEDEYRYVDEFMLPQLGELLSNYGEIVELWFDGFWRKQQSGWTQPISDDAGENISGAPEHEGRDDDFIRAWRNEGAYRWQMDRVYQYCKRIQPNCLIMNNPTTAYKGVPLHPADARCGEKYTNPDKVDRTTWSWLGKDTYLPLQIETTMSVSGNDQFKSGNWFWHPADCSVASKNQIRQYREVAKKMNANLLLNCGPMDTGQLRPEDIAALAEI